ncbi:MAG: hypothetical protein J0M08_10150 [Bacteroidetes bacterium]|nr:hypothetical protein [Bacteroidota bacterium]
MKYLDLNIVGIILFWFKTKLKNYYYYLFKYYPLGFGVISKTKELKNSKADKCAIVFANGPSLGKISADKVALLQGTGDYEVLAVNSYITSTFADLVKPNYYIISDPAYIVPETISEERLSKIRKEELKKDVDKLLENKTKVFISAQYYTKAPFQTKYAFFDSANFFSNNVNILKPAGYLSMTAYKALAIACFMGYKNIYICGFDNNYFKNVVVDENNGMYYIDTHFYNSDNKPPRKVVDSHSKSIGELLYFHHYNFKHLEKFKAFPIVNLDKEGLVDSFSKKHDLDIYK